MVTYNEARLDAVFGALAHPSRRAMLARLTRGESSVTELAAPLDMSLPAVLKHLHVLEAAGLVTAVKAGRVKRCQLDLGAFDTVNSWLADTQMFWRSQLDSLAHHLEHHQEKPKWPPLPHPPSASPSAARSRRRAKKSSARGQTRKS